MKVFKLGFKAQW